MFYPQMAKKYQRLAIFSLAFRFHDKSGGSDKSRESGWQQNKAGDFRSNQEGWNISKNTFKHFFKKKKIANSVSIGPFKVSDMVLT